MLEMFIQRNVKLEGPAMIRKEVKQTWIDWSFTYITLNCHCLIAVSGDESFGSQKGVSKVFQ